MRDKYLITRLDDNFVFGLRWNKKKDELLVGYIKRYEKEVFKYLDHCFVGLGVLFWKKTNRNRMKCLFDCDSVCWQAGIERLRKTDLVVNEVRNFRRLMS